MARHRSKKSRFVCEAASSSRCPGLSPRISTEAANGSPMYGSGRDFSCISFGCLRLNSSTGSRSHRKIYRPFSGRSSHGFFVMRHLYQGRRNMEIFGRKVRTRARRRTCTISKRSQSEIRSVEDRHSRILAHPRLAVEARTQIAKLRREPRTRGDPSETLSQTVTKGAGKLHAPFV